MVVKLMRLAVKLKFRPVCGLLKADTYGAEREHYSSGKDKCSSVADAYALLRPGMYLTKVCSTNRASSSLSTIFITSVCVVYLFRIKQYVASVVRLHGAGEPYLLTTKRGKKAVSTDRWLPFSRCVRGALTWHCTQYYKDKFAFLAPQSALGFKDRSNKAARFDVSILLARETREWVQSMSAEKRVLTKFEGLMKCDVTAGMVFQKAGGELMRARKYRGAELGSVANFDVGGNFGNLYLMLKHKDASMWEKHRPVVPGFAAPDRLLQNRIGRCLCFFITEIPGHFNVATTQDIGKKLAEFNSEVRPGEILRPGKTMTGVRLMDDCALLLRVGKASLARMRRVFRGYVHDRYPEVMTVEQTSGGLEWTFCEMHLAVTAGGVSTRLFQKNVAAGVDGGTQLQFFPVVAFSSDCPRGRNMASSLNLLYRVERHCTSYGLKVIVITDVAQELAWQGYPEAGCLMPLSGWCRGFRSAFGIGL
ncbi:hypothetical protein CYMTET_30423 [Cymbomonas tetramitiformis]|uniref:Uncharacterized protein n=1 Tax=Cymbomonas tetramitiformis TaxID=36881 RepID=A0AAE0KU78_9CHLO|nr:hypothetical protein CYMTET_30423 [Cymbomonas tetramitiformis]